MTLHQATPEFPARGSSITVGVCRHVAHLSARRNVQQAQEEALAGYGKPILIRENFNGLHVWDRPALSGPSG